MSIHGAISLRHIEPSARRMHSARPLLYLRMDKETVPSGTGAHPSQVSNFGYFLLLCAAIHSIASA